MLLDTHALLWLLADDHRLGPQTRAALTRASSLRVSAASAWEIAIKVAAGRLEAPERLLDRATSAGLSWVSVTAEHAWTVRTVQGLPSADPFDRLLVAQAASEDWTLVTADRAVLGASITPGVRVLDARA